MAVAVVSLLSVIAYANSSYSESRFPSVPKLVHSFRSRIRAAAVWTRLMFFIMPLVFVVSIARAG